MGLYFWSSRLKKQEVTMKCNNCGASNEEISSFCKSCGKSLNPNKADFGSVDMYFKNKNNTCQSCGQIADLKKIKFYKNIGLLIMRRYGSIEGNFCRKCIDDKFWNYTLITPILRVVGDHFFYCYALYFA